MSGLAEQCIVLDADDKPVRDGRAGGVLRFPDTGLALEWIATYYPTSRYVVSRLQPIASSVVRDLRRSRAARLDVELPPNTSPRGKTHLCAICKSVRIPANRHACSVCE